MQLKKKPSSHDMKLARKGGFHGKHPKKPKVTASLDAMKNWGERYNNWVDHINSSIKNGKEKEALKSQIRQI